MPVFLKELELAKQAITAEHLKKIEELYIDWAEDIQHLAYGKYSTGIGSAVVSQQQQLLLRDQLKAQANELYNSNYKLLNKAIYVSSDAVVKSYKSWLKDLGFSGNGFGVAFSNVNNSIVEKLVSGQLYDGGWNLSKSIWGDNQDTLAKLYEIVAGGVAKNMPIKDIAEQLSNFVNPKAKKMWNLKNANGIPIYPKQVEYNSQRLARTLIQHGYQQSVIETTKDNPFIMDYIWWSNGPRACELCRERNGKHFKADEMPLDHPNGMCIIEPIVADDIEDQLVDWFNSEDGTYPEIDKFAGNFGYIVDTPKSTIFNPPLDKMTKLQKQTLGSIGFSPADKISYEDFLLNADDKSQKYFAKYWQKKHPEMGAEEYWNKYVLKQKTTTPKTAKAAIKKARTSSNIPSYNEWIDIVKKNDYWKMQELEKKILARMSQTYKEGIFEYTTSSHKYMNSYLRYIDRGFSHAEALSKSRISEFQFNQMQNAIKGLQSIRTEDVIALRRGTGYSDIAGLFMDKSKYHENKELLLKLSPEEINDMFQGMTGEYSAFVSTSSGWHQGFSGDVEVILFAPKGTQGGSIITLSNYESEGEFLLPPGTRVECVKVEKSDGHSASKVRMFLQILV